MVKCCGKIQVGSPTNKLLANLSEKCYFIDDNFRGAIHVLRKIHLKIKIS